MTTDLALAAALTMVCAGAGCTVRWLMLRARTRRADEQARVDQAQEEAREAQRLIGGPIDD